MELFRREHYICRRCGLLLNEAATLFQRRYYLNGIHPGNFGNMFVHAPNGKEGSIRVMPIAETGVKDEFLGIKNATQADVITAHRVPPSCSRTCPHSVRQPQ